MTKKTKFLYPIVTLVVLAAVAFMNVRAVSAEEPVAVTITGTIVSIDEIALSLELETEPDVLVVIHIPDGFDLTTLGLGDEVQVAGTQNGDGSIAATEILILAEGIEVTGTITKIDELLRFVEIKTREDVLVVVFLPAEIDLTTLSLCDRIQVAGTLNEDNSVTALDILILYEAVEVTGTGTIISMVPLANTFTADLGGIVYTFVVTPGFDWTSISVGDTVDLTGMTMEDGNVLLVTLVAQGSEEEGEPTNDGFYCTQSEVPHPFGARLADHYGVDYATLQNWFCQGYGWGQIMLALKTGEITGADPSALLAERGNGAGWGEIWQGLRLIGRERDATPPAAADTDEDGIPDRHGRPDNTDDEDEDGTTSDQGGPKNDEDDDGRPDNAGPKNDEDGDGRPDHNKPPKNPHHKP